MRKPARSFLLNVRRGKVSERERAGELQQDLTELATPSPLPGEPNEARVEEGCSTVASGAFRTRRLGMTAEKRSLCSAP
jgi:hypothetical protein